MNMRNQASAKEADGGLQGRAPPMRGLLGLSVVMLAPSLAISIANVALPTLEQEFHAPFAQIQWVLLAYLLAVTTTVVSVGRLGDLLGRRRLLLAGICLFTISSMLCAAAPSILFLIAARAAQGVGAAVMMALSTALVADIFPKERIGRAMGLLGGMSAIGTAIGPSIGGLLIASLGWPAIFGLNAVSGILGYILIHRFVMAAAPGHPSAQPRFDFVGTLLLVITLAAYTLAVTAGHGRFGLLNYAFLSTAATGGILFLIVEARAISPLVSIPMLRNRALSSGLATNALVSTVMMATLVVGPFYLATSLGLNAALVGLSLSVGPAVAALSSLAAGRLVDRFGPERMTLIGLAILAAAMVVLTVMPATLGVAGYVMPIALSTLGYAVFQAANNTLVMREPRAEERGVVSGMLNLSRNLGLITGASVMGAIFAHVSAMGTLTNAPAEAVAAGMRATYGISILLSFAAIVIAARIRPARPPIILSAQPQLQGL